MTRSNHSQSVGESLHPGGQITARVSQSISRQISVAPMMDWTDEVCFVR